VCVCVYGRLTVGLCTLHINFIAKRRLQSNNNEGAAAATKTK